MPPLRPLPRGVLLVAAALLVVHSWLIVADGRAMDTATDESSYFNSGNIILRHGWKHIFTVFQGPVPLYANQLFVPDFPRGGYDAHETPHDVLERGRLGTLPFALLSAALVFLWARTLFGEAGGLFALLVHALNPLLLGYGSMILVDAHHAAMVVLGLFVLWCWLRTRSPLLIPCIGISLGLALSTKYLTLFLAAVVGTIVAVVSARRARGALRRATASLLCTGGVVLCMLATMHALYRFHEPLASFTPGDRSSHLMRSVSETPVVGQLIQAFPAPFLRGLDFQLRQGERPWKVYVDGVVANGHPDFYVRTMLYKTPEIVLICATLALVLRLPRFLRKDCPPGWKSAAVVTFAYVLVSFGYLSLFTGLQLGVRYIIPVFPLLSLWQGALVHGMRHTGAGFIALFTAVGGLLALDLRHNWPDLISYYNLSSGGQEHAFRHFKNTSSDFGQHAFSGAPRLRERDPGVQIVGPKSGPRLGRVAVDCNSLRVGDFRWLEVQDVVHHLGASWWVFDVTQASFERAISEGGVPGLRSDLCVALLGAGEREQALPHLALLDAKRAAPLNDLIAALDAGQGQPTRKNLEALVRAWNSVGRFDLGEALFLAHPDFLRDSRAAAVSRARACEERRDYAGTIAVFDDYDFLPRDLFRQVLFDALTSNGMYAEARAVFQAWKNSDEKHARTGLAKIRARQIEGNRDFLELLR